MRRAVCAIPLALALASAVFADEPSGKYRVVTPKSLGITATGINERGEIVGFEWVEEKGRPGVLAQAPIYARGKEITYLPLLDGYTATFPAAVSDDGLVVGRVSKPGQAGVRVPLRNQAFAWDAKTGISGLGTLKDDWASVACGVTRDGRRISGFSVGDDRIRGCIWDRTETGWAATALPEASHLSSHVVAISGNGRHVAGADGPTLCVWSWDAAAGWKREAIAGTVSLMPRAINNSATVVGVTLTGDGLSHAAIWTRDGGYKQFEKPAGYVRSEANAINNAGVVVGMADGPGGSETGPNAFVYEQGRLRLLDEAGPTFTAATALNDQGQVAGVLEEEEEEKPAP